MSERPTISDDLLKHSAFVRNLATRLTVSQGEAADVEQDMWLAAMKRPPGKKHTSLRAWFSLVAKNLVARKKRDETRSTRYAKEKKSGFSTQSAADNVVRQELIKNVIDCVVKLPEIYKSVVLLRYYEGLSVREVGDQIGASHATVRHRLDRAMEMLKQDMDDVQDGTDGDWRLNLAIICGAKATLSKLSTTQTLIGVGLVSVQTKSAVVSIVAFVLLIVGYLGWDATREIHDSDLDTETVATTRVDAKDVRRRATVNRETEASNAKARTKGTGADRESQQTTRIGEIRLEVIWKIDGSPAIDVPLRTTPFNGFTTPWVRNEFWTDESGAVVLKTTKKRGFIVQTSLAPYAVLARIDKDATGVVHCEIPPGIDVHGKVIDQDGLPVSGAEVVVAGSYAEVSKTALATTSQPDGTFLLRQVAPTVFVAARHPGFAPSRFAFLKETVTENPNLTLVVSKKFARLTGKVFDDRGWPISQAVVKIGDQEGCITTERNTALYQSPATMIVTKPDGSFDSGPLQPGKLRILVASKDKTLARFVKELEIRPGKTKHLEVKLEAPATLFGVVRDQNGDPLAGITIKAGYQNDADIRSKSTTSNSTGHFELACTAAEKVPVSAGKTKEKLDLVSGQRKEWNPVLTMGKRISGKIVCPDGISPSFWSVELTEDSKFYPRWSRYQQSNVKGEFKFVDCPDGTFNLSFSHAKLSFGLPAIVLKVDSGDEDILVDLDGSKLPSAHIIGRVANAQGKRPSHVAISMWAANITMGWGGEVKTADGSFDLGPLAAGTYRIEFKAQGLGLIAKNKLKLIPGQILDLGEIKFEAPAKLILDIEYPGGGVTGLVFIDVGSVMANKEQVILKGQKEAIFHVTPGSYTIFLRGDPKEVIKSRQTVELKQGTTTRVKVRVEAP